MININPLSNDITTIHILLIMITVLTKLPVQVISAHTPKRKKDKPKSIHLIGTDTPEVKATDGSAIIDYVAKERVKRRHLF